MKKITKLKEWEALNTHQKKIADGRMQTWFEMNPQRFLQFSMTLNEILFDYSKNLIQPETIKLLINLANASHLKEKIDDLYQGNIINYPEKQPALHTLLRDRSTKDFHLNNVNISSDIEKTQLQMSMFIEAVRTKKWLGVTHKPIKHIVNVGIGGSHLGPLMTTHALSEFADSDLEFHFISNVDKAHIHEILKKINPETTLFIISSKSFSTLETVTNANFLKNWLQTQLNTLAIENHFIAVTAEIDKAIAFGIKKENIFEIWSWIGGRYSVWSAIGLPLALMIGMENFYAFLQGGYSVDQHFKQADFSQNMPIIMALLGIWYINFFETRHHAIVPYSHYLHFFRMHLQQLYMESNGKNVSHLGEEITLQTCPVIFGDQGCNGQHAFHQLLHQGKHLIPVDFILVGKDAKGYDLHQDILIASGLSQAQALMKGKSYDEAKNELKNTHLSAKECEILAKHKTIPGNRPSNTIFLNRITPYNLGALLAIYEHKIFVQGVIWQINSFDQWGVELGKNLLPSILDNFAQDQFNPSSLDSSTLGLINYYKNLRIQS